MVLINTFVLLLLVPFQRRRRIPSTRDEKIEEGGTQHQHHQKKVVWVLARMVIFSWSCLICEFFIFALPLFDLYLWVCDWERLVMESSDFVYGSL